MTQLLAGVTWRRVSITFVINTAVVALAKLVGVENPFPDLLISGQVVGFSIMFAVSATGNLALRRISMPVAQLIAVVLGRVPTTGTLLLLFGTGIVVGQGATLIARTALVRSRVA